MDKGARGATVHGGQKKAGHDLATNIHTQGLLQERIQSKCNRKEIHSRGYQRGPHGLPRPFLPKVTQECFLLLLLALNYRGVCGMSLPGEVQMSLKLQGFYGG